MRRCAAVLVLACVGIFSLDGCGGATKTVTQPAPASPSSAPVGTVTTSPPAGSAGPDAALATGRADVSGRSLTLRITQLKRSGSLVTLNFTLTNQSAPQSSDFQMGSNFDDGIDEKSPQPGSQLDTLDGIYLIDQVHQRKYPAARDSQGLCVCTGSGGGLFIKPQATVGFTATFGAAPPDVRVLDVAIPQFKTFTGVPLS